MDILAVNDQENRVQALQAGAAGKALNAGLKGFNAKTPGHRAPKTPFRVPLNDENATFKAGKSVLKTNGKGNENLFVTAKKGGKLDENAFVTPAGARTRAPLGMKTTNAKGNAFQTPAPLSASAKTQKISPRLRRPKVKVHQPEVQAEEEDDVPEIEYMPPKEVPLPDFVDDEPLNLSMFEGANMTRGIRRAYIDPIGDDGLSKGERELEESLTRDRKRRDEEFDRLFTESVAKDEEEMRRHLGIEPPKKAIPKGQPPKKPTAPSTLKARSAAAALSPASKPAYAAPTATVKSRRPTSFLQPKKTARPAMDPSASRHAAATTASKSTIGYSKGRGTTQVARKPLSNVTQPPSSAVASRRPTAASSLHNRNTSTASTGAKPRGEFSRSSSTSTNATLVAPAQEDSSYRTAEDVQRELELMILRNNEDEDDDAWMNQFSNQVAADAFDDENELFQFQVPEGL
ncbi:hypothetical protein BCR34DRAFT_522847 [Clohesyomyces aquaticus]|uniref:Uncharacterized protein n=1 Tax=Clohesyomyces aquaticus TaxID=1231657 RepID=A0A1Y1YPU1_9PLEO|nr:hypothetical protein BCR34DRAFT_522847 [Clohesyomyces aquaticus]